MQTTPTALAPRAPPPRLAQCRLERARVNALINPANALPSLVSGVSCQIESKLQPLSTTCLRMGEQPVVTLQLQVTAAPQALTRRR